MKSRVFRNMACGSCCSASYTVYLSLFCLWKSHHQMWAAHEFHSAILLVLVCVLGRENASDRVGIWLGEDLRRLLLISCLCQSRLKSPNLRIFDVCGSVILSTTGLRSIGEDQRKWDIAFDQRASCYNKKIWFAPFRARSVEPCVFQ